MICLSNSFFNSSMKIKNEMCFVFYFIWKLKTYESTENWSIVVNYLNFVFHIDVKSKSNDKFLNFVFQFIKNTKWHFGYTDSFVLSNRVVKINWKQLKKVVQMSGQRKKYISKAKVRENNVFLILKVRENATVLRRRHGKIVNQPLGSLK